MDLSPHVLAFLEHEMNRIKDDPTRESDDRILASTVLDRIEEEKSWEGDVSSNFEVSELLS